MSNRRRIKLPVPFASEPMTARILPGRPDMSNYPQPGARNAYWCDDCHSYTVVVHRDAGVTPMFLACRATADCRGTSRSMMYPKDPWPAHIPEATYEWYLPDAKKLRKMDPAEQDHIMRGGLALREVTL